MIGGWQPWIADQFAQLGRWLQGRFVLDAGPDDTVVAAEELLQGDYLRDLLLRTYERQDYADVDLGGTADLAIDDAEHETGSAGRDRGLSIAASRLTRHYPAPLTTVALVGLSAGVGFDLSSQHCSMVLVNDLPFRLVLGTGAADPKFLAALDGVDGVPADTRRVATIDELRQLVWRNLYADHLSPLFSQVAATTKIAPALIWTNAAEWVGMVHDAAIEYLGTEAGGALAAESEVLFAADELPGVPEPGNPLRDKIDWIPVPDSGGQARVQTRRLCCLTYLLADRFGRLCQNCPYLSPEDRVALARERHGVPMGTPGGEAEQRSIAQGLQRPSTGAFLKSSHSGGKPAG